MTHRQAVLTIRSLKDVATRLTDAHRRSAEAWVAVDRTYSIAIEACCATIETADDGYVNALKDAKNARDEEIAAVEEKAQAFEEYVTALLAARAVVS